jgi:hypothetical protein
VTCAVSVALAPHEAAVAPDGRVGSPLSDNPPHGAPNWRNAIDTYNATMRSADFAHREAKKAAQRARERSYARARAAFDPGPEYRSALLAADRAEDRAINRADRKWQDATREAQEWRRARDNARMAAGLTALPTLAVAP